MLPNDIKEEIEPLYRPTGEVKIIIKAADRISALIKCIVETAMGNKEFSAAKQSILASIKEMNCKEADIFIEEFLDSYSLTLDEQNGIL